MLATVIDSEQILPKGSLLNGRISMDAENYYILTTDFLELDNIVKPLMNV